MKTNLYCPSCESFLIMAKKRGLFQKLWMKKTLHYTCLNCHTVFTSDDTAKNPMKDDLRSKYMQTIV